MEDEYGMDWSDDWDDYAKDLPLSYAEILQLQARIGELEAERDAMDVERGTLRNRVVHDGLKISSLQADLQRVQKELEELKNVRNK